MKRIMLIVILVILDATNAVFTNLSTLTLFAEPTGRTATYVIAASTASATSTVQADYVCDGTADNVEIQSAINALPAIGGKIQLTEGTFNIAATINLSDIVSIEGANGQGSSATRLKLVADTIMFQSYASGTHFHMANLKMDGDWANRTSGTALAGKFYNSVIENVCVADFRTAGFNLNITGDNITTITKCTFEGNAVGINTSNSHVFTITDNIFHSQRGYSISIANGVGVLIANNFFGNPQTLTSGIDCIWAGGSVRQLRILGNYFDTDIGNNVGYNAVVNVNSPGANGPGVIISGNNVMLTGDAVLSVFSVTGTSGSTRSDVVITNNAMVGDIAPSYHMYLNYLNRYVVMGNSFGVVPTTGYVQGDNSSGGVVRANAGYVTENSGTATIVNGQTTVVVNHGLASTPTRVVLTPTTDTGGRRYWISAKTATTFTISLNSSYTSAITFDWRATVGEQ